MKKLLAVGATTAAMVLAGASPALADVTIGDEVLFLDASQTQVAAAVNTGDANAGADDGSAAFASTGVFIGQYQLNGGF